MKVVHIITNLRIGGAQVMLQRLVRELSRRGIENEVIALESRGAGDIDLAVPALRVRSLDLRARWPSPFAAATLRQWIADARPDVVQTWLYHADLVGGLAARAAGADRVVWGIHHGDDAGGAMKARTRAIVRLNARLSPWVPDRIVCCAHAARDAHAALGYAADKLTVIPNGFDVQAFHPDEAARGAVRAELGVPASTRLVTMVARFHPHKDHRTFLRAAARLDTQVRTAFVLVGDGITPSNVTLAGWIAGEALQAHVHLLGPRHDTARLMAASDIVSLVSASTEALPLVIGEAMACGTPVVATDAGDCASVIGDPGAIVPPADAAALARAWAALLALPDHVRRARGLAARERIVTGFSLEACADAYAAVYRAGRPRLRHPA